MSGGREEAMLSTEIVNRGVEATGPDAGSVTFSVRVRRRLPDFVQSVNLKYVRLGYRYLISHGLYLAAIPVVAAAAFGAEVGSLSGGGSELWRQLWAAESGYDLASVLAFLSVLVFTVSVYFMSRPLPVYLIDFACYRPSDELKVLGSGLSGLGEHHVDVALLVLRFGLLPKLDSRQALRVRTLCYSSDIGSKVSPETFKFSKCGYGFPVEESAFVFNSKLLTTNELQLSNGGQVPDWLLGENRCYIERGNSSTYLCISQHSSCIDSIYTYELGYRCACSTGYYKGNLHLPNGCQDINECERPEEYHCYGRCLNLPGNFSCTCPSGKEGDPRTQGGCRKRSKQFPIWLGILIGLICTCILSGFSKVAYERAKLLRAKRKCFEENGGLLLQEQINVHREIFVSKLLENLRGR